MLVGIICDIRVEFYASMGCDMTIKTDESTQLFVLQAESDPCINKVGILSVRFDVDPSQYMIRDPE